MRDINFLKKKYLENKIKFVQKSDLISNTYYKNSADELKAAKIMINQKLFPQSISHMYYSCYLLLQSLLFKCGIKCEDHNSSIIILKLIFEIENKDIKKLKDERIQVQYYLKSDINIIQLKEFEKLVEKFRIDLQNFIENLSNENIEICIIKLKEILVKNKNSDIWTK